MSNTPRRELPPLPNFDRLKKEAKARLGDMRARAPSVQLAEAQFLLAREYGFPNWAALKAEVEKRAAGPLASQVREGRARGALHRAESRSTALEETDLQSPAPFFRAGMVMTISFVLVAVLGLAVVFLGGGSNHFLALLRALTGRAP